VQWVTFDELVHAEAVSERELLALDAALDELALAEPRQAEMIECRFFGGQSVAEAAATLGPRDGAQVGAEGATGAEEDGADPKEEERAGG